MRFDVVWRSEARHGESTSVTELCRGRAPGPPTRLFKSRAVNVRDRRVEKSAFEGIVRGLDCTGGGENLTGESLDRATSRGGSRYRCL